MCNPLDLFKTQDHHYEQSIEGGPASQSDKKEEVTSTTPPEVKSDPIEHSISPMHTQYLKYRPSFLDGIKKDFQVSIEVKEGSLVIVPSKSSSQTEVVEAIDALLRKLDCLDIHIPPQASSQVYPLVMTYCTKHDLQHISSKVDATTVVGESALLQQLQAQVDSMCEAIVQKTLAISLSPANYVFLKNCAFPYAKQDFSHISLQCQDSDQSLVVSGSIKDIKYVQQELPRYISHTEVPVLLDPLVIEFLNGHKGKRILLNTFQGHEVVPFWNPNSDSFVLLTRPETAAKLEKTLPSLLMQHISVVKHTLPHSFQTEVAKTAKFSDMQEQLHQEHSFTSSVDQSTNCLVVVGVPADAEVVQRKFIDFINQECFKTLNISLKRGVWRLIHTNGGEKWKRIVEKLLQKEVNILSSPKPENTRKEAVICIKGEIPNINHAADMIRQLGADVKVKQMPIYRPGIYHYFFKEDKGKMLLAGIEREAKVCIEISIGQDDSTVEADAELLKTDGSSQFQKICCSTDRKKTVNVYIGDITEFNKAEVIVNAANEDLQHYGGVANAIATKGGPIIQSDCNSYIKRRGKVSMGDAVLFNRVGNLPPPYKAIVHGVGPRWNSYMNKESNMALLRKTLLSCLHKAKGYSSIAIPAISSGVFGFPADACANALFQAITAFNPQQCNLNEINFIIISSMSVSFVNACKAHMKNVSDFTNSSSPISNMSSPDLSTITEFTTSDVADFVVCCI